MAMSHKIFQWILDSFAAIDLEALIRRFQRLVMTILKSDFKNKKLRIQYGGHILKIQSISNFLATIGLKTITRIFFKSLKTVLNSDSEMTNPIWRSYIRFTVKIRRFWSGKLKNYYSSVWEINTNLIINLNSDIENPKLRSHSWCFDKIHITPYSIVWKIHKEVFLFFLS